MTRTKKALLGVGLALALWFLGGIVYRALVSEETRIRLLLADMVEAFNEERTKDVMSGLADDYQEDSYGLAKEDVRKVLVHAFFTQRAPETKAFVFEARVPEESVEVSLIGERKREARAVFLLELRKRAERDPPLLWSARVTASLEKGKDGWVIRRSSLETVEGSPSRGR